VRMANAGVSREVIDVVVAVSFPERFAVAEDETVREQAPRGAYARDPGPWGFRRPYFWDPFFYGGGFGYPGSYGYGYGYGYGYYRPVVVVVEPRQEGPVGRIINGRGYTRGRRPSDGSSPSGGSIGRSGGRGSSGEGATRSGGSR